MKTTVDLFPFRATLFLLVVALSLLAVGLVLILPRDSKVVDLVYGKF
jgi:hypothetical protein